MSDGDVERDEFAAVVGEKLGELSGEKPLVGEQELADALEMPDVPERLLFALDDLAAASVAVQVGQNAEQGRMWRHSGLDDDEARRMLAAQRELSRREAAAAEAAEEEADADLDVDEADAGDEERPAPRTRPAARAQASDGVPQRVELPMAVAGALDEEGIGKLVTAGLKAAEEAGVGFEFIVT